MEKATYHDASTQVDDDFHNEKDIEKILKLQNDITRTREQASSRFNENKILTQENSELVSKFDSIHSASKKLNKEIVFLTDRSTKFQSEL